MRLYELLPEHARLLELAETHDAGDPALVAALEDVGAAIEQKCAGIGKVLAQLDADAEACAAEVERLTHKASRFSKNADQLRAYVLRNMVERNIEELRGETFTFKVVLNPERVEVDSLEDVPAAYKNSKTVTTVAVDKRAVLKAYDSGRGEIVPGVRIERGQRLVIK